MSKKKLTGSIVVLAVVVIGLIKLAQVISQKPIDPVEARSKGNPAAKVKVVEFIDFQCPACANGAKLLSQYTAKHADDIYLQMKYFPLTRPHAHAMRSALYSECAGRQGKFWPFHELLMAQQPQWSPLLNVDGYFQSIAREAGIDVGQLNACLSSEAAAKSITDDRQLGQSLGVQSTPTYFINNKMVVGLKSLAEELNIYFPTEK